MREVRGLCVWGGARAVDVLAEAEAEGTQHAVILEQNTSLFPWLFKEGGKFPG